MKIVKKEWNGHLQVKNNYWVDVKLQIEREPYALRTSEVFHMILVRK